MQDAQQLLLRAREQVLGAAQHVCVFVGLRAGRWGRGSGACGWCGLGR